MTSVVSGRFRPLLGGVTAVFFTCSYSIVLLSKEPSSLPTVQGVFLGCCPMSPGQLVALGGCCINS